MKSTSIVLLFALFAIGASVVVAGDEVTGAAVKRPVEAWAAYNQAVRELPRPEQRDGRIRLAKEYLDAWNLSGQVPTKEDWLYLGQFEVAAGRASAAFTCLRTAMAADTGLTPTDRARAGQLVASLLANSTQCEELEGESCVNDAVQLVSTWLGEDPAAGTEALCAAAHMSLGGYYFRVEDIDNGVSQYLASAMLQPANAYRASSSISRALMGSTHAMADYPKLLVRAKDVQKSLVDLGRKAVSEAKDACATLEADSAASDKEKQMAERRLSAAERNLSQIESMLLPFELLGKPAPAWTLEHAFGDVKSLADVKGKVVLVDFWATWCGWCVKSLPALRDVYRDYHEKGFTIVGVTASASTVYDARYDLDDDMAKKKTADWRPVAAARFARGDQSPDPENGIFAPEDAAGFRAAEEKAIERFIANHEIPWSVVIIDKEEPSAKFALKGWPHAMVIDKEGRIRYFKVGALLRDREEQVKHFRKVLDALLAE